MNAYIRIKWALTESNPAIKYYFEDRWSATHDNLTIPVAPTLALLDGLHYRLGYFFERLPKSDLQKSFIHPEHNREFQLKKSSGFRHGMAHTIWRKSRLVKLQGW